MAKSYSVSITNGTGSEQIVNGTYNVTATSTGYDSNTIDPSSVVINSETNTYEFTISANGSLTLHVTEDGTSGGVAVVGATFYRCDSTGTTYGNSVTTDSTGNATLPSLPYSSSGAPTIYYKQVNSDSVHNFDSSVKNIVLTDQTTTVEVTNALADTKTFTLTDSNYEGLNIDAATININETV